MCKKKKTKKTLFHDKTDEMDDELEYEMPLAA